MYHIAKINAFRSYYAQDKATVEAFAKLFRVEVATSTEPPRTIIAIELQVRPEVTTYRNHLLVPVFNYTNGKSDWQIYPKDADYGWMERTRTLSEVKEQIDELTQPVTL